MVVRTPISPDEPGVGGSTHLLVSSLPEALWEMASLMQPLKSLVTRSAPGPQEPTDAAPTAAPLGTRYYTDRLVLAGQVINAVSFPTFLF